MTAKAIIARRASTNKQDHIMNLNNNCNKTKYINAREVNEIKFDLKYSKGEIKHVKQIMKNNIMPSISFFFFSVFSFLYFRKQNLFGCKLFSCWFSELTKRAQTEKGHLRSILS